jgi:hypothetical protein
MQATAVRVRVSHRSDDVAKPLHSYHLNGTSGALMDDAVDEEKGVPVSSRESILNLPSLFCT